MSWLKLTNVMNSEIDSISKQCMCRYGSMSEFLTNNIIFYQGSGIHVVLSLHEFLVCCLLLSNLSSGITKGSS